MATIAFYMFSTVCCCFKKISLKFNEFQAFIFVPEAGIEPAWYVKDMHI